MGVVFVYKHAPEIREWQLVDCAKKVKMGGDAIAQVEASPIHL
jgi:hypothetical protein